MKKDVIFCLQKSVGSFGLAGLDRLLCFMIVKELQTFQGMCTRLLNNAKDRQYHDLLDSFSKSLGHVKAVVGQGMLKLNILTIVETLCNLYV